MHVNEFFLVIALTEKVAPNTCGSTSYSHKEGLSFPFDKCFKDLDGKQLKFYQEKHNNLELIIIDECTIITLKY